MGCAGVRIISTEGIAPVGCEESDAFWREMVDPGVSRIARFGIPRDSQLGGGARPKIKRFSGIPRPRSGPALGLEPRNSPASRRGRRIQATKEARRFGHAPQTTSLYLAEPATGDRARTGLRAARLLRLGTSVRRRPPYAVARRAPAGGPMRLSGPRAGHGLALTDPVAAIAASDGGGGCWCLGAGWG